MRHLRKGRKLGLKRGKRKAFLRTLAANLIMKGRIKTTEARAKALKPFVEKLITRGKKQTVASLRILMKKLPRKAAYKVHNEISARYNDRNGGYLRIVKQLAPRKHDASKMAVIEFV